MYLVWLQGCGTFLLSHSYNFNLQENISKVIWTVFSYSPTWYCQGVPQSGPWYKQYIILLCYSPTWYCHGVPQSGSWYNQYIIPLCYSPTWYCRRGFLSRVPDINNILSLFILCRLSPDHFLRGLHDFVLLASFYLF